MERYCSTGQSPQRAVAPTEEEKEEDIHEIEMLRFERMRLSLSLFKFQDKGHHFHKNGLWDFGNSCSFYWCLVT
jgi:hypothetical protein